MAVFQLKLIRKPPSDPILWNYDRAEVIADGVVHVLGVSLGIVAIALCIIEFATGTDRYDVAVYTVVLLAMFGFRPHTIYGRCLHVSGCSAGLTTPSFIC